MATQLRDLLWGALDELRFQPIDKWIRAEVGGRTVVDTRRARLVLEPRRVVGSYAVPETDLAAELVLDTGAAAEERPVEIGRRRVLDPSTPFRAHGAPGVSLTIRTLEAELPGAGFRADDPDLAGYVILDWDAFDQWYEEDEPVIAHPHDPFSRIDCLRSSRHVRIAHGEVLLADSRRPVILFETGLPPRYYIPREDVVMSLLEPTPTATACAYKGWASYWSARVGDTVLTDIAWSYPDPLNDALPVRDLIAFFSERLDVTVDGELQSRPNTPWS